MFRKYRPMWIEIDLDKLAHNIKEIRRIINPDTKYISVVKADAYGHGAVEAAKVCMECGVDMLAVSMLDEALELIQSGIKGDILILGYTPPNASDMVVQNGIIQTCYSYGLAKALSDSAVKLGKTARIHIAVDTGMSRIGFQTKYEDVLEIRKISELPNLKIEGIFTHFASADSSDREYTKQQYKKFNEFLNKLSSLKIDVGMKHASNSAGVLNFPDLDLDAVRPGIIQYGLLPSDEAVKTGADLKPVMSVKANVTHVKEVEEGTSISYGRKFVTSRKSRIVTLPVGYADGYSRLLFNKAKVIINGKLAPVVGAICMDQCMVDATDVGDVKVGDEVILMGRDGDVAISADDIAAEMGTINYEIICMFSKRVPRVYIKNGNEVKVKNLLCQTDK